MARSIGRYEIREELGRGGMAAVYLALDPKLEREVALKLMDQQLSTDPTFVARFEREAKTVASLEHSAIVPLHDYGEADGWLYLVMRFMKGGSLKQLIAQGPLTSRQAYGVVRRIGSALDKAHGQGVVHRDLKPGNILLDEEQESYLSDFGIVKVATGEAEYLTQTGQALGTFAYMSPEQVMGQEVDGRSDIYALGLVLYEMITGKHPFGDAATTSGAMAVAHAQQPVPDIREANPAAPAALNEVVQKAMAKDRDERYASGREMALAMYEALTRKPEAAAPAGAAPIAQEPQTRQPAAPVAQQPSRPVTPRPASPPPAPRQAPPPAAQPAREEKRGIPIWLMALIGVIGIAVVVGAIVIGGREPEEDDDQTVTVEVVEKGAPTDTPTPTNTPTNTPTPTSMPAEEPPAQEPPADPEEPPDEEPPAEEPPTHTPTPTNTPTHTPTPTSTPAAQVVTGSSDGTVRLWDLFTGTQVGDFRVHEGVVRAVAFSPNGNQLATGGFDQTVLLWDLDPRVVGHTLSSDGGRIWSLAYNLRRDQLAAGTDEGIQLWNPTTGAEIAFLSGHQAAVRSVAFSPNGEQLATASVDGTVRLWDTTNFEQQHLLRPTNDWVMSVTYSPDGNQLAAGSRDGSFALWRLERGEPRERKDYFEHEDLVMAVAYNPADIPNGVPLATGSWDGTVKLWEPQTWPELAIMNQGLGRINSLVYSPDGKLLVFGSENGTVQLWDVAAATRVTTLSGHQGAVNSVAYRPDGGN